MAETTETIDERIEKQEKLVAKLEESVAGGHPSEDLKLQLDRERDTLNHMNNSLFGVPKYRAEEIAAFARAKALEKVIQSAPENED